MTEIAHDHRLRIAFVGAGAVAQRHASTLATFSDVCIVSVTDTIAERAREFADTHGASVAPDVRAMVDTHGPEALYICVPPFAHGEPETVAIETGIPFFVEKPLALDAGTAEDIAAAVDRSGLITAVGYHWRYLDTVDHALTMLAKRVPRMILAFWLDKVPPPSWWILRSGSGGQVVEQATHVLDLARLLVGEVDKVEALAARTPPASHPEADIADVSTALLRFDTGALGTLAATCLLGWKRHAGLQVFGDGFALDISESEMIVDIGDGPVRTVPGVDAKQRADRAFVDAVRGDVGSLRTSYADALRTHRLTCRIAAAADHQPR